MDTKPVASKLQIPLFIEHAEQGTYFTIPFTMPENIETFTISYSYERRHHEEIPMEQGSFITDTDINRIDLGLITPDGKQIGWSGSDKYNISISEINATPGYHPCPLAPGEWQIIVGAYKVAEQGADVLYELTFTPKYRRLFKGDLHTHAVASDGVLRLEELAQHARSNGLDYIAITDHNRTVPVDILLQYPDITIIPGMEWTHYRGHANFLGVGKSFDEPFYTNTLDEVKSKFISAHEHGALIVINHPMHFDTPFQFDLDTLPFDLIEVWQGPMVQHNLQALGFWQSKLVAGNKIPTCGGSDYHRDALLQFPGAPTTCVYAMSASSADLLKGLKQGHAYITFDPTGPSLEMTAGDAILGDSVNFSEVKLVEYKISGLLPGDVVNMVTANELTTLMKVDSSGELHGVYTMKSPGFARIEILRVFLPYIPAIPALISNPIYFDG